VNAVIKALPTLSLLGFAGIAAMAILGFEEPPPALLAFSTAALIAPLLAILLDLALTRELSRAQKRAWLRHVAGTRAPRAWSAYLACKKRRGRQLKRHSTLPM
jgi:hypothetical protein